MSTTKSHVRRRLLIVAVLFLGWCCVGTAASPVVADGYQRISGEGSSWAANAIDAMRVNVTQYGITVDYNPSGSTAGRKDFLNGTVDFAASDIPFQFAPEDGSAPENPAPNSYAYMPITAGGTAFMYNLKVNGKRVTNLRLSGENVSKIFTGAITMWNDPAIAADNPGLTMPARTIVPVVRSDGSGSTAQFTLWMISQFPAIWTDFCNRSGRAPKCGSTSFYPTTTGMIAQSGDLGVAGYVAQGFAEGAIGYVNYSYALGNQFPVVKVLNAAGFYTEPTPSNVAVSLLAAQINTDAGDPSVYLTQDLSGVYVDADPRAYALSSYSYLILPTVIGGQFNEAKGKTLGAFSYYAMCQAQQQSASLGYSPMPVNLVQASFDQITKIPGVVVQDIDIHQCHNPTFAADGSNLLADQAPQPQACDQNGPLQCPTGTGGMSNVPTAVSDAASGAPVVTTPAVTTPAVTNPAATTPAVSTPAAGSGGATPGVTAPAVTTPALTTPAAGAGGANPAVTAPAVGGSGASGSPTVNTTVGGGTVASGAPVPGGATGAATDPAAAGAGTGAVDPATGGLLVDPAAAGTNIDPSAAASVGQGCDPDTGVCAASTPNVGAPTAGGAATQTVGAVTPTTLGQSSGFGSSLVLKLLVIMLTLALVLAPAYAWRHYSSRGMA
ncbi:MAG: Phosphate transporter substrate-binding protein [Ilumatobacteraceae bacterium]|nr:Phosphate transporter substrate-binding protein [Ilumatobacteraceae bacterium]